MNWYIKFSSTMFSSTGTISLHGDNWTIINVDPELARYYLTQFNRSRPMLEGQIMVPKWGPHISLIRGEEVKDQELLAQLNGNTINFQYSPEVQWDSQHAFLNVDCPEGMGLREELGLSRAPHFPLHLTFGVKMQI